MVSFKHIGVALLALTAQTFAAAIPDADPADLFVRQAASSSVKTSSTSSTSSTAKASASSITTLASSVKASSTTAKTSSTTSRVPDSACTFGPKTRGCWKNGLSIATDFDTKYPTTGKTVKYTLTVTNVTDCNTYMSKGIGDGFCRPMLLINEQFPGPTINAEWGDYLEITVVNNMQDNGTSFHWHGLRQLGSCQMDGANGVTECPIPPGKSFTYKFQATQYGTTWYHSHHSAQYGDGIAGAIVINGPATSNYDVDLGPVALTETYDETAWTKNWVALHGGPPTPINILFNGSMVNSTGGGRYNTISVTQGKTYRLRLINMSVDTFFVFSMDGHQFQIITSDLVPVHPYNATSIMIGIGQRYDIVFTANQPASNYWLRAEIADCSTNVLKTSSSVVLGGILNYDTISKSDLPVTTKSVIESTDCTAEPYDKLVPWWQTTVPKDQFAAQLSGIDLTFDGAATVGNESGLVQWFLNDSSMVVDWGRPTLQYFADGDTNYTKSMNVFQMPAEGKWSFWIIHNNLDAFPLEHPIHLHGHDFFHLGSGTGVWDGNIDNLKWDNPMRRDVMILPGSTSRAYLIIAFPADNPGAWLMHCHIAWHVTDGLSLQFVENPGSFKGDLTTMQSTCKDWNAWAPTMPWHKEVGDSGL